MTDDLSPEEIRRRWYKGDLTWMLRPNGQTKIHDFIVSCALEEDTVDPIVVNAHRRLGKSFLNVLMAVEDAIRDPGQQIKYICGEKEQVRDIFEPLYQQIIASCPDDLMPKRRGFTFRFFNPRWKCKGESTIKLVGANYKMGDMGRGTACDKAYLDEVRDFKNLQYFVQSVLSHQFVGRKSPRLVMTSTVPWSMDHDFTRPFEGYIPQAISRNRYICIPGSENPDFTERDKKIVLSTLPSAGEKTTSYRREVGCELIGDSSRLIIPEYQEIRDSIVLNEYVRPSHFIPHVVLDSGFDPDQTAILFGYVDYMAQLLIFEAAVVEKRMTSRDIATAVKSMEINLGYDKNYYQIRRLADLREKETEDLRRDFNLPFQPVLRFNSDAALIAFRSKIADRQIRLIMPACRDLDYQLQFGYWNEKGSDFQRSESLGHWDAGKAAVYMTRMACWRHNPYPAAHDRDFQQRFGLRQKVFTGGWATTLGKIFHR